MIDIPPQISIIIFSLWLILFLAGRYQFNKIKQYSMTFVESNAQTALDKNPKLSINEYYGQIYQQWAEHISKKYFFIPHKTELFPILSNPENVAKRINFTPEWVGAYLQLKSFHLERTKEQEKRIDEILAKARQTNNNSK
jgi:intein-encoded DNA endonuclease-like protein